MRRLTSLSVLFAVATAPVAIAADAACPAGDRPFTLIDDERAVRMTVEQGPEERVRYLQEQDGRIDDMVFFRGLVPVATSLGEVGVTFAEPLGAGIPPEPGAPTELVMLIQGEALPLRLTHAGTETMAIGGCSYEVVLVDVAPGGERRFRFYWSTALGASIAIMNFTGLAPDGTFELRPTRISEAPSEAVARD